MAREKVLVRRTGEISSIFFRPTVSESRPRTGPTVHSTAAAQEDMFPMSFACSRDASRAEKATKYFKITGARVEMRGVLPTAQQSSAAQTMRAMYRLRC